MNVYIPTDNGIIKLRCFDISVIKAKEINKASNDKSLLLLSKLRLIQFSMKLNDFNGLGVHRFTKSEFSVSKVTESQIR